MANKKGLSFIKQIGLWSVNHMTQLCILLLARGKNQQDCLNDWENVAKTDG